jgi:exosortase
VQSRSEKSSQFENGRHHLTGDANPGEIFKLTHARMQNKPRANRLRIHSASLRDRSQTQGKRPKSLNAKENRNSDSHHARRAEIAGVQPSDKSCQSALTEFVIGAPSAEVHVQEVKLGEITVSQSQVWRGVVLCLALGWLYFDVLRLLLSDWYHDENYSHGLLVPFIAAYALWQNRDELRATVIRPLTWLGAAMMVGSVLLLWAGTIGAELFVTRISLLFALISLTLYFGGTDWLKQMSFPLLLLLLAIPIPLLIFNRIAFPLQLLASDYAARIINLIGIPAFREGNVIELAQMKLEVVEACSGIRSLMSLTTLAVTYVYFAEPRWWRKLVLVASVIPIAIATNAARVTVTGIMAHYRGEEAAQGFQHAFSGWLIFLVAMVLLLAVAQLLRATSRFLPEKWR